MLIVNTQLVPEQDRPQSIRDLIDPKWKGRVGIAKPLFGTTATHAAVLFAHWGDEKARQFFLQLKENAQVLSGNKQVALSVGRGELAFGLTDTDDAIIEKENGQSVEIIYPDQEDGGLGALFIPNTLAMIQGAPNTQAARRLVDYLLSPEVEAQLAAGRSAQFPLNSAVPSRSRAAPPQPLRHMAVDFPAAAAAWDSAAVLPHICNGRRTAPVPNATGLSRSATNHGLARTTARLRRTRGRSCSRNPACAASSIMPANASAVTWPMGSTARNRPSGRRQP